MKQPKDRIYVGLREFRRDLTDYVDLIASGTQVMVRYRNKVIGVFAAESFLLATTPDRILPSGYYAAHFRLGTPADNINETLSTLSPAGAIRVSQFVAEVQAQEQNREAPAISIPVKKVSRAEETRIVAAAKNKEEDERKAAIEELKRMSPATINGVIRTEDVSINKKKIH